MAISEVEQLESSTLLAQTGLLVAASDAEGRMALLSPGMQELFDIAFEPMEEAEFADRFRLLTADGSAPLPTEEIPLVRARRGEVVRDALVSSRTPAGCLIYLRCNASPLIGPDGHPSGAIVLVQDVTAERAAHERQDDLRARLLDTVNHHLRTPVTHLLGYAETLEDEQDQLSERCRRAVDAVLRATHELSALLTTVSDLVDLDQHTELTKTHGNLSSALGQVVRSFRDVFDQRRVLLRVDLPDLLPMTADFAEIRRAVAELLKNAALHAPARSTVVLRARRTGSGVEVSVADRGPGIPQSERDRLVQPFERGSRPEQDVTGKGLGLAIASTVAAAHGGSLLLAPNRPTGLLATLQLPAR